MRDLEGWKLMKKTNVNNVSRILKKSPTWPCVITKRWEQLSIIVQRHQNAQVKQAEQGNSDTAGKSSGAELGSECESFQTNVRKGKR